MSQCLPCRRQRFIRISSIGFVGLVMAPDDSDALAAAFRDKLRMSLWIAPLQNFPQGRNVYPLPVAVVARSPCDVVKRNQRSHLVVVRPIRSDALYRMVAVNEDCVHA